MIRRGALLAALGLALTACAPFAHAPFAHAPFALTGDPAPLLWPRFTDGNRALTGAEVAGPVVFLNIGATRCPPCRVEMPAPDALQREWDRADFAVVPIRIDKEGIFAARRF